MKWIFDSLGSGSVERQKKKKNTVMLIYATMLVIILLLAVLLISPIIASFAGNKPPENDDTNDNNSLTYDSVTVDVSDLHTGSLILVNKNNEYIFEHNPAVVPFPSTKLPYNLRDTSLKANQTAMDALTEFIKGLNENVTSANIVIMTAYRTKEYQDSLGNGTPGGYSDFHTGMSFELKAIGKDGKYYNVDEVKEYSWLYENAHKYGFIVRYPADTDDKTFSEITGVEDYAYVFRYVGTPHATYIYQNGLCLEEYLELLRENYTQEKPLNINKQYDVYYCEASQGSTEIQIPSKYTYDVSGDNMNGYIVTVYKNKTAKN